MCFPISQPYQSRTKIVRKPQEFLQSWIQNLAGNHLGNTSRNNFHQLFMPLSATAQRSQSLHSLCQQNLVKKKRKFSPECGKMEAGVACGNARARSIAGSPTLTPSSSRPPPPATALERPTNHATECPASEDHATPHQIEPFHNTEADPPRFPAIPAGRTSGALREGFGGFGGGSERDGRGSASMREVRKKSVGRCRSRLLEVFRA